MPVPVKDPVVPIYKLPSMVAWYRLETSSIAVNLEQMKYAFDNYRTGTLYIPIGHYCVVRSQYIYVYKRYKECKELL